ncbi:Metaxin-1 -like protein [Trichinella murrelli]|uniref:Metaxin-1-like protein n=2 Tax=Trichinella murrelli TaxID=144512 RepID=A0A0V0TDZ1_9BILA|nr:Metaxin-1 -like protein [Trichinella murrelli]
MPAEFTLPSFDAHSLQYMAFSKIASLPLLNSTPTHTFALSGFEYPMSRYLEDIIYDKCDYVTLKCFVDTNLYPAYMSMTWLDECNYNVVTKPLLAQHWGWLSRWAYNRAMRRTAEIVLLERYHTSMKEAKKLAAANAMHCVQYLSERLGEQPYFFGNNPSAFDAYVFGYLAPIILMPQSNDKIKTFINWNCPNIHAFVFRILENYLDLPALEKEEHYERMGRIQHDIECYKDMMAQRALNRAKYSMKNVLAFATVAVALSIACAYYTGCHRLLPSYTYFLFSLKVIFCSPLLFYPVHCRMYCAWLFITIS